MLEVGEWTDGDGLHRPDTDGAVLLSVITSTSFILVLNCGRDIHWHAVTVLKL